MSYCFRTMSEGLASSPYTRNNVHVKNAPAFRSPFPLSLQLHRHGYSTAIYPGRSRENNKGLHLSIHRGFLADVAHENDDEIRSDCSREGTMISDSVVVIGDE